MNKEEGLRSLALIDFGKLLIIIVPILYSLGWSYAYHYFRQFHLGLLSLQIPKEHFFQYSFWTIRDNIALSLILILVLFCSYIIVEFFLLGRSHIFKIRLNLQPSSNVNTSTTLKIFAIFITPFLFLIAYVLIYFIGERAATDFYNNEVNNSFSSYQRIEVQINNNQPSEREREWRSGCYKLLLRSGGNLYLFYPPGKYEMAPIDIIPMKSTKWVRLLPHYNNCAD